MRPVRAAAASARKHPNRSSRHADTGSTSPSLVSPAPQPRSRIRCGARLMYCNRSISRRAISRGNAARWPKFSARASNCRRTVATRAGMRGGATIVGVNSEVPGPSGIVDRVCSYSRAPCCVPWWPVSAGWSPRGVSYADFNPARHGFRYAHNAKQTSLSRRHGVVNAARYACADSTTARRNLRAMSGLCTPNSIQQWLWQITFRRSTEW